MPNARDLLRLTPLCIALLAPLQIAAAQCVIETTEVQPDTPQPDDRFGRAVAIDDDLLLVGRPGDDALGPWTGSAALYTRDGTDWDLSRTFLAADGATLRQFGRAVSVAGSTVAVGAADDFLMVQGAAYVFGRHGPAWTEDAKLVAGDPAPNDRFGWSIATDGQTVVVGAVGDDELGNQAGAAYVYERSGNDWPLAQKLLAADGSFGNVFGSAVDLDGDTLVVGAHRASAGLFLSGKAYVFERIGGSWTQTALLLPTDLSNIDEFGRAVAISGDTIAVGAHGDDELGASAGAVYVFERSGGAWVERQKLLAPGGAAEDGFGYALDLDGDGLAVGARGDDDAAVNAGAVHVYERQRPFWYHLATLTAPGASAGEELGRSVSLTGDTVVAGSEFSDAHGQDVGRALAFDHVLGPLDTYCEGAPNSAGGGARMAWGGSTSVSANDLVLVVHGAVPGQPGLFYYGGEAVQLPFGDGYRCVANGAQPVFRLNPALVPDFLGDGFRPLDLGAPPLDAGPGAVTPGSTWHFQFYYRDPGGPGGSGFNFSDGLRATFCP